MRQTAGRVILRISWSIWSYPTMIMLSTFAAALVTFVFSDIAVRPLLLMWFLFVCPGMTVVHFFQLDEAKMEWILALALSIAIDAFIASILLYAGWWSPEHIFIILISFCFIGALIGAVIRGCQSQVLFVKP